MRRRMSPPRTIRRAHGVSYGGCLVFIVGGIGALITGLFTLGMMI